MKLRYALNDHCVHLKMDKRSKIDLPGEDLVTISLATAATDQEMTKLFNFFDKRAARHSHRSFVRSGTAGACPYRQIAARIGTGDH
jgi:hypothetical protein